ncbi:hypothetical protein [Streptomyces zhihengii]
MSDMRRERDSREPAAGTGPATGGDRAGAVDQVVFRWGGNQGRQDTGMTAVAHSCPPRRAAELGRELGPLLWVTGTDEPRPSVVRTVSQDGQVMLVQRWPTTDRSGRPSTVSHVLAGPGRILDPRTCLSLAYGGWGERSAAEQASGRKDPVPAAALRKVAQRNLATMGQRLPEVEQALVLVTAEWLRDPRRRVSLLADGKPVPGWPDRADAALVYYGLFLLFHDWLPERWTFATYDTVDSHPLRLTCVPRWESGEGASGSLARVAAGPPSDPHAHALATRLVARLLAHGPEGPPRPELADLLPDGASLPWERRRERLEAALAARRPPEPPRPPHADGPAAPERDRHHAPDADRPRDAEPGPDQDRGWNRPTGGGDPDRRRDDRRAGVLRPGDLFGPLPELSPPGPATPPRPRQAPDHPPVPDHPHGTAGPPPRETLYAALRSGSLTGVPALLESPGEERLLHELRQPDLTMEAVFALLDELTGRLGDGRLRPATRHALCAEVLGSDLYLDPSRRRWSGAPADPAHLLARAAELFALVVAPLVRDPLHLDDLLGLAERVGRDPRSLLGDWLRECVLALPPDEAPDLPPAVWQVLLRDAFHEKPPPAAPPTSPAFPPQPHATTPPTALPPDRDRPPAPTGLPPGYGSTTDQGRPPPSSGLSPAHGHPPTTTDRPPGYGSTTDQSPHPAATGQPPAPTDRPPAHGRPPAPTGLPPGYGPPPGYGTGPAPAPPAAPAAPAAPAGPVAPAAADGPRPGDGAIPSAGGPAPPATPPAPATASASPRRAISPGTVVGGLVAVLALLVVVLIVVLV